MKKLITLAALLALSACASGEVRDTLGLKRAAPDEFKVVSRPPLSVPPDFTLRAPEPGAAPRGAVNPEREASRIFLKPDDEETGQEVELFEPEADTAITPVLTDAVPTSGESVLLGKLGAEQADPEIRSKLYGDEKTLTHKAATDPDATLLDRLVGKRDDNVVIDPLGEAARIRENLDNDKPINEGEVPVIEQDEESTLDKLF